MMVSIAKQPIIDVAIVEAPTPALSTPEGSVDFLDSFCLPLSRESDTIVKRMRQNLHRQADQANE